MSKRKNNTTATETTAINLTAEQLTELTKEIIAETEQQTETAETEQTATETEQTVSNVAETATDKDFAEIKAVAKSIHIKGKIFHVYVETAEQLQTEQGEGTDSSVLIGRYGEGSNGKGELLSIWCRRNATNRTALMYETGKKEKHAFPSDFGIRFSNDTFDMFNSVAECHELMSALDFTHAEIKHNERRFSFPTLQSITAFLAVLYNAFESAQTAETETAEQTTEIEQTETATA